jgi:hypothetical protein
MNFRTLALSAVTLAVLAPAAFASSNSEYQNCISRDKPNNGGISCEQLRDKDESMSYGFKAQADTMEGKKPVYLFDTWTGKSTK